ncbi:MAG: HAD family phosphatase [Treponema sp.]|nr:HAD family phosphatase [Treponema sp.]
MSVKAAAFDFGGVISLPQDEQAMDDMARAAGIETSLMRRLYWGGRSRYDQGLLSGEEYFRDILTGAGIVPPPGTLGKLVTRDLESWSRVNPQTEKLIRDLKAAGLTTAVLSNMPREFADRVAGTLPVLALPDVRVYSCDAGAVKPGEAIYRILLSRLGIEAEELAFFDDLEANVASARTLGIAAFLWEGPEKAREELENRGVTFKEVP